jgi:hypothetical protein
MCLYIIYRWIYGSYSARDAGLNSSRYIPGLPQGFTQYLYTKSPYQTKMLSFFIECLDLKVWATT